MLPRTLLLFLTMLSGSALADVIGQIELEDGRRFEITRLGGTQPAHYHLNLDGRFVPLSDVQQLAKIDMNRGQWTYLVVLDNGELREGARSYLFYDRVSYRDTETGDLKSGYAAVMKERGSNGFMFVTTHPFTGEEQVVEVANPNDIVMLKLGETKSVRRPDYPPVLAGGGSSF